MIGSLCGLGASWVDGRSVEDVQDPDRGIAVGVLGEGERDDVDGAGLN